jgi:nicotinamidase-related amidase
MSKNQKIGLEGLLRPEDSILVLIDHQPFQFTNLNSHEPTMIINNVIGLAKSAKLFNVPTILTTVIEERGGISLRDYRMFFLIKNRSTALSSIPGKIQTLQM